MTYWYNAFTHHYQWQADKLLAETSHTDKKQKHYISLLNDTVKHSCLIKGCIIEMFCSAISLQSNFTLNTALMQSHQHRMTSQSHNHRPALMQADEFILLHSQYSLNSISAWYISTVHLHNIISNKQIGFLQKYHT